MLGDINSQIAYFRKRNELLPNYIILNITDYDRLITAAHITKLIPENKNNISMIQSARIIPSSLMPEGNFDVVGN